MLADRYNGKTIDEAAEEAGGYVEYYPGKKFIMEHDYRAAIEFCNARGTKTADMTDEEWDMFKLDEPLVYPKSKPKTEINGTLVGEEAEVNVLDLQKKLAESEAAVVAGQVKNAKESLSEIRKKHDI